MRIMRTFTILLLILAMFFLFYGALDLFHTRTLVKETVSIKNQAEVLVVEGQSQEERAIKLMVETRILERESADLEMRLKECNGLKY